MAESSKRFIIGSWIVAGIVAIVALLDLTLKMPFGGNFTMVMDILFLISAAILGYLCWDAWKDLQ